MKVNCYECQYRGSVPGDAHSCCNHPTNKAVNDNPMLGLMAIFASVGRVPPIEIPNRLNVKGDAHGIRHGWFNWPFNFDPVWLLSCDGFTSKEAKG